MSLLKKKENKNKTEKEISKIASHQIALEDATPRPLWKYSIKTGTNKIKASKRNIADITEKNIIGL